MAASSACPACHTPATPQDRYCTRCGGAVPSPGHARGSLVQRTKRAFLWGLGIAALVLVIVLALLALMPPDDTAGAGSFRIEDAAIASGTDAVTSEPLGARGVIAPDAAAMHACILVDAPHGTNLSIAWFYERTMQGEVPVPVEPGTRWMCAFMERPADRSWPLGHYYAKVFHVNEHLLTVHANVTEAPPTGATATWDAYYEPDADQWMVRVLVRNDQDHVMDGLHLGAWVNTTNGRGTGQEWRELTAPPRAAVLYVLPVLHPTNNAADYVDVTLRATGPDGFEEVHQVATGAYYDDATGTTWFPDSLAVPHDVDERLLDPAGAFAKWRVEYVPARDAWVFSYRVHNYDPVDLEDVTLTARVDSADGTASAADVVRVEGDSVTTLLLEVQNPTRVGGYVSATATVTGPTSLAAVDETREGIYYSEYDGATVGGR